MAAGKVVTCVRFYTKVLAPLLSFILLWSQHPSSEDAVVFQARSLGSMVAEKEDTDTANIEDRDDNDQETILSAALDWIFNGGEGEKTDRDSGVSIRQAWNISCRPILASGRDILRHGEAVPCWEACHDFLAIRILESPFGNLQGWLQSKIPLSLPLPASLSFFLGVFVWFVVAFAIFVFWHAVRREELAVASFVLGGTIQIYLVLATGLVCMASCFAQNPSKVVQEVPWAEPWLLGVASLRLPHITMKASLMVELLIFYRILVRVANKLLDAWQRADQTIAVKLTMFIAPFVASATCIWFLQLFIMIGYFLFKAGSHGAFWVCAKSASASAFGWMPREAPYYAGLCYAFLSFAHGLMQNRGGVKIRKRPRKQGRKRMCISDRSRSHLQLGSKFFTIFVDVSLDIAQTMLFFCRGQPFFGILNVCGLAVQASILLYQMARGQADSDSLLSVILQSDAVTHYMSSMDADMAVSAFYGKAFREAFGETYLSFIIAVSAVFTVPLTYTSDVMLFMMSVMLSMASVKSGVADALEFYRAEEESTKDMVLGDGHRWLAELRIRAVPANHYYMRAAYARERCLTSVGFLRVAEALTCPVASIILACASDVKTAAVMCSLTCTFLTLVLNFKVAKRYISDFIQDVRMLSFDAICGFFIIVFSFCFVAICSPFWVFLLYASPLTVARARGDRNDDFQKAVSFESSIATKCWFAAITWAALFASLLLPGTFGVNFAQMFNEIKHDAMHHFPDARGIVASVKLVLMVSAFASVFVLALASSSLKAMRKKWAAHDDSRIEKMRAKMLRLKFMAEIYYDFFVRYEILCGKVHEDEDEEGHPYNKDSDEEYIINKMGTRRDPAGEANFFQIVMRKLISKIYGDEFRPERVRDVHDPDFDYFEDFLWRVTHSRRRTWYMSPTCLGDDILALERRLPARTSMVFVPAASAILKLDPLLARLRNMRKMVNRLCIYEDEADLIIDSEVSPNHGDYALASDKEDSDAEDSINFDAIWNEAVQLSDIVRNQSLHDLSWVDTKTTFEYESFKTHLECLLEVTPHAYKYFKPGQYVTLPDSLWIEIGVEPASSGMGKIRTGTPLRVIEVELFVGYTSRGKVEYVRGNVETPSDEWFDKEDGGYSPELMDSSGWVSLQIDGKYNAILVSLGVNSKEVSEQTE